MKYSSAFLLLFVSTASCGFLSGGQIPLEDDKVKVPGKNPLYFCSDPKDDILVIDNVDLDPNPPKAGEGLSISASGNVTETIEEGAKVHLVVKYGMITLINQESDLCKYISNVNLECPVEEGTLDLSKSVDLPKEIPPGKYTVMADVFTKDKKAKITCLTADVVFSRK